jgi:Anti-sigma factor NepR
MNARRGGTTRPVAPSVPIAVAPGVPFCETTEHESTEPAAAGTRMAVEKPARPETPMHTETQIRRSRGQLGRDVQAKLGRMLQIFHDDIVKEGVPEQFNELIQQLEERKNKGAP